MSKFTPGKWEYEGAVPFRIKSEYCSQIALVLKPEDTRLIAAISQKVHHFIKLLELMVGTAGLAKELLARIDGGEASDE